MISSFLHGICREGSILDGLDDWPRSATRKDWFRITRELVASAIADMDLDPFPSPRGEAHFNAKQLEMFAANGDVLLDSTFTHTN